MDLSNLKQITFNEMPLSEGTYTQVSLDDTRVVYKNTENSDSNILSDLLECKAYATALLYLNENYTLMGLGDLSSEDAIKNYYTECESLLNKNITIVEEVGIPLTDICGYKIFESSNGILRGNGKVKIKESFSSNPTSLSKMTYMDLDAVLNDLIEKSATEKELNDFLEAIADNDTISNEEYTNLVNKAQDTEKIEEDGTQTVDIAPKVDQEIGITSAKPSKKYNDILLSGITENINIINKGFLKNTNGQYERGNFILVKEGDSYLAIHKNKLKGEI